MKRSMANGIAAAGECDRAFFDRNAYKGGGGAVELVSLAMARVMADEGAEIGKKVTRWVNM